jgi:hypothetical protein
MADEVEVVVMVALGSEGVRLGEPKKNLPLGT